MSEFEMANEYKELCTVADDMIEHPENKETFNAFGLSKRLIDKGKDYSDLVTITEMLTTQYQS